MYADANLPIRTTADPCIFSYRGNQFFNFKGGQHAVNRMGLIRDRHSTHSHVSVANGLDPFQVMFLAMRSNCPKQESSSSINCCGVKLSAICVKPTKSVKSTDAYS